MHQRGVSSSVGLKESEEGELLSCHVVVPQLTFFFIIKGHENLLRFLFVQ